MIPDWLAKHLEDTGKLGPDRIGRAARAHHCKTCGQLILTGLDNDMCAGVADADPVPLAPLGEALAIIAGRNTYALRKTVDRLELQLRDSWQIAGDPAGTTRYDVVAQHSCDAVNLPTLPSVLAPPAAAHLEHPPY
jgi:hypothetical protein